MCRKGLEDLGEGGWVMRKGLSRLRIGSRTVEGSELPAFLICLSDCEPPKKDYFLCRLSVLVTS